MLKVLVACEYSGAVRDAFIRRGHDAVSCDLLPTESPGPHHRGDVLELLSIYWDLIIAHPPCNYLTHYTWAFRNQVRYANWWQRYKEALHFWRAVENANTPLLAIENPPQMHPPAKAVIGPPTQRTNFYEYGDGLTRKGVGLWLKGLPPLLPTAYRRPGAVSLVKDNPSRKIRAMYREDKPSFMGRETQSHERSRFLPAMAEAMAAQWGDGDYSETLQPPLWRP